MLVVDIGNTNIVAAYWYEGVWSKLFRFDTKALLSPTTAESSQKELLTQFFQSIFTQHCETTFLDNDTLTAIISSVVPSLTMPTKECLQYLGYSPVFLVDITLPSPLAPVPTKEMGQDLFANAISSYVQSNIMQKHSVISQKQSIPTASITVDMGTALTFTAVDGNGHIVGVSISPGIKTAFTALVGNTSQLSNHQLRLPNHALGITTEQSLNTGIMRGYQHLIIGMVEDIKKELQPPVKVYATGGMSALMESLSLQSSNTHSKKVFDVVDSYHTLTGLRILAMYYLDRKSKF